MISRRIVINVITFLALSALLIGLLTVTIFRIRPKYSVYALFENTGGAFTGQEVTYRGVTVGRIGTLDLTRDGVRIELVIEEQFDEIPDDADARIMFKSAVGEQFVDLLPHREGAPYLRHGDVIPNERTSLPVQQEELLRLLDQVLEGIPPEALSSLVDTLGTGLGGRGEELHLALSALDPLTAVFARRTAELNRLAINADRAGSAFVGSRADFEAGVRHLATVARTLADAAGDTERLLEVGSRAVPQIAGLVAARKQQINDTIANLAELTRLTEDNLESFRDLLNWLPVLLDTLIRTYDVEEARFRFGQVIDEFANPPCTYGTPRRSPQDRSGNAPYHPITEFDCVGADSSPQQSSSTQADGDVEPSLPEMPPGSEGWLQLITTATGRR